MRSSSREVVMGFHPTPRGFAWIVYEGAEAPLDWGMAYSRSEVHQACLRHMQTVPERHRPETLVLEQFDGPGVRRRRASRELCEAIVQLAATLGVTVRIYSRHDVRLALAGSPWVSLQKLAQAVVERTPVLSHRLPCERKPWDSPDRRIGLFCAAAVVLTHFQPAR